MGTWGTGIFADDLAADVRGDWRDAIAEGLDGAAATDRLLERYKDSSEDLDESPRFWMALAAVQAETGRLQAAVRDRALAVIANGADIDQFAIRNRAARRDAVSALAGKLTGPQREPVALKQPKAIPAPVSVGDVVEVRGEKRSALFVVVALTRGHPPGTQWPVVAALLLNSVDKRSQQALAAAPLVCDRSMSSHIKDPVVDYHAVSGPSRGPRSFTNFARVVAHGIRRPDAPPVGESGQWNWYAQLSYTAWQSLPTLIDEESFEGQLALTDEWARTRPRGLKALAWRANNFRRRKAVERNMRRLLGR